MTWLVRGEDVLAVAEVAASPRRRARGLMGREDIEGVLVLRHGSGAFVSENAGAKKVTDKLRAGQEIVAAAIERLRARGVSDEEIRRLVEAELSGLRKTGGRRA